MLPAGIYRHLLQVLVSVRRCPGQSRYRELASSMARLPLRPTIYGVLLDAPLLRFRGEYSIVEVHQLCMLLPMLCSGPQSRDRAEVRQCWGMLAWAAVHFFVLESAVQWRTVVAWRWDLESTCNRHGALNLNPTFGALLCLPAHLHSSSITHCVNPALVPPPPRPLLGQTCTQHALMLQVLGDQGGVFRGGGFLWL